MDYVIVDRSGGGYRVSCEFTSLAAAMKGVSMLLEIREAAFASHSAPPATLNLPSAEDGS